MARETFLRAAGPALITEVATILGARGIPVMPLKGVLLQKLVYDPARFRPIVDVDLLVPEARFAEAYEALRAAGFSQERWEPGAWQVSLKRPGGVPLAIDLHHRLSRTARSRLTGGGLFQRGMRDTSLFGATVTLPSHEDLFAHLLLHATLHWVRYGRLHRGEDFSAVVSSLALGPVKCAEHLRRQGLAAHAMVLLPMVLESTESGFLSALRPALCPDRHALAAAWTVQTVCARFPPRHPARRLAGVALAPSLAGAFGGALRDRWSMRRRAQQIGSPTSSR